MPGSIEDRLAFLERNFSAHTTEGEPILPTYLQVDPTTGLVTAVFTGGIILTEQPPTFLPTLNGALQWRDAAGNTREFIQSQVAANIHELDVNSAADGSMAGANFAQLSLQSKPAGISVAGDSRISASAGGPGGNKSVRIIDDLQRSNFMQLIVGTPANLQAQVGSKVVSFPGGANVSNPGAVTFPSPFPTAVLAIICTSPLTGTGGATQYVNTELISTTGFTILCTDPFGFPAAGDSTTVSWLAIGN